ncbi:hypothetical protein [Gemmata sp.]|uniref:hypothetical protein n=1 Tax=Gemmata sp. TaxID=1914242 RepID=UPI003F71FE3C
MHDTFPELEQFSAAFRPRRATSPGSGNLDEALQIVVAASVFGLGDGDLLRLESILRTAVGGSPTAPKRGRPAKRRPDVVRRVRELRDRDTPWRQIAKMISEEFQMRCNHDQLRKLVGRSPA